MPEKMKKKFRLGRSHGSENENVVTLYTGRVRFDPSVKYQASIQNANVRHVENVNSISSNLCFHEVFLKLRFGPVFADFLPFLSNSQASTFFKFEIFLTNPNFWAQIGESKINFRKNDEFKSF